MNIVLNTIGCLIEYLSFSSDYQIAVYTYYLVVLFFVLPAPMLYFYVLSLVKPDFKISKKNIFHIVVPVILSLISGILFYLIPLDIKTRLVSGSIKNINNYETVLQVYVLYVFFIQYVFVNIQIPAYSISIIMQIKKHKNNIKHYYSNVDKVNLNWIKYFVFFLISAYLWNIYSAISQAIINYSDVFYLFKFGYIFILGFFGFKQRDIYENNNSIPNKINNIPDEDYTKLKPKSDINEDIVYQLIKLMKEEKAFLNPDLRLNYFSEKLNIHKNTLSNIINKKFQMNFYNWVNSYRICEAKVLFDNTNYNNYSIEAIMQMAGFKSKSVFNPLFKQKFGVTPSEYRKKLRKN